MVKSEWDGNLKRKKLPERKLERNEMDNNKGMLQTVDDTCTIAIQCICSYSANKTTVTFKKKNNNTRMVNKQHSEEQVQKRGKYRNE